MANIETGELNLLNLENKRRQQPKIAHEHGAGSRCSRCGPKCAGFDLHYWRKVCQNCRCGKELHNVGNGGEDPEYLVGRLLDDPVVKENDPAAIGGQRRPLSMDSSHSTPNLEQIPSDDRKRALDRQLPVHDLDPERCNALSDQEKRRLEEYVKNVKQNAVGRGMMQECPPRYVAVSPAVGGVSKSESVTRAGIKKLPGPPPQLDRILESKMNHLSMQPLPKPSENSRKLPNFVTARPYQSPLPAATHPVSELPDSLPPPPPLMEAVDQEDFLPPPPEFVNLPSPAADDGNLPPPPPPEDANLPPPPPPLLYDPEMEEDAAILHQELKSFMHFLDEKDRAKRPTPGKLKSSAYMAAASTFNTSPKPYASPSGSASSSPLMPRFGCHSAAGSHSASGSPKTRKVLITDIDLVPELKEDPAHPHRHHRFNNNTTPVNNNESAGSHPHSVRPMEKRIEIPPPLVPVQIPEVAVQVEKIWLCQNCTHPIRGGEVAIFAERAGSDKCWHPDCFSCSICHEVLAELVYFFSDSNIFCGRHYAEKMDIPRCKACDELIFAPEYTSAEGATWHTDHFCCWLCDTPLAGHQYTPIEGQPHCLYCYQKKYGKDCYECKGSIRADQTRISHGDMHWHADAGCFRCHHCRTILANRQFLLKNEQIYCSRECSLNSAAPIPE